MPTETEIAEDCSPAVGGSDERKALVSIKLDDL